MSVAQQSATADITYDDLYRRWEEGNWSATALDFSEDRDGWQSLTDKQRRAGIWFSSFFFYGEASVADTPPPYTDAPPLEEQKSFLAPQQVDEARHAIF